MTVPTLIHELIERFDRNREAYVSGQYNEAQLRLEFVDPFFKVLGWDVYNEQGHSETYKEVLHEDSIKIGGHTKAPDYCFRIGGLRKFFVEAKKPSVNLKDDISPAFQLRIYAWNAQLPLSILTDFEEFAVYDCRFKPNKNDSAAKARILYLKYTDYLDNWDKIEGVFSKDAILKGSFDKYIESTKGIRGTAEVDKAFLEEIESWRVLLAHNLALRNKTITTDELNFAVQSIIDRIVFLRICEDRGIEEYGQLMALQNGTQIYGRLFEIFKKADERYNSGLFHFQQEHNRAEIPDELTPSLILDDKPLKTMISNLYYPESPYEFSVLPPEILGQVYEQFLGKVIRLTPKHRAKVEDKPEVRKAGGVFYTPTYIVDYIIRNTLETALNGKNPNSVAKLKILDPACGSGSFLINAYQHLLGWHRNWYEKDGPAKWTKKRQPRIYKSPSGEWKLTTSERKRILLNNIYGVDIDPQAVEVTKLSLLLKVLEEETEQTLNMQLRLFRERALPDLGENIKCGNSLVAPDFYQQEQTSILSEEELFGINAFDWQNEFPNIFKGNNPGFNIVIGNPPYGADFDEVSKEYIRKRFKNQSYQLDSYLVFLELAINELLKRNGLFGMIIPNPWLTNLLQKDIRRFIVRNTRILEIVHFLFAVFPKGTVDTEIVLLQKANPNKWQSLVTIVQSRQAFINIPKGDGIKQINHEQKKWIDLDGDVINIFLLPLEESLAERCSEIGEPLSSLCKINVGIKPYQTGKGKPPQTKDIVENRIYDSDYPRDSSYRQYLRGKDISRYTINPLKERYIKFGPWLAEPRPAADFDASIKIFMRQTGDSLVAAIDTEGLLCLNNMHVLVPKKSLPSPYYLLGLINSNLLNWYYHTLNPEVGEALAEVKKTNVARLPIYRIDTSVPADRKRHDQIVKLVEQIVSLNRKLISAKTPDYKTRLQRQINTVDRRLNKLVYELYDLTEKEIVFIEEQLY